MRGTAEGTAILSILLYCTVVPLTNLERVDSVWYKQSTFEPSSISCLVLDLSFLIFTPVIIESVA